jgi:hypothetical protein
MKSLLCAITVVGVCGGALLLAQSARIASPSGSSATEIRGKYVDDPVEGQVYKGGKWIEITAGRPIKRGRDLWGNEGNYGKMLNAGAPVWRAGANVSTRLKTELPLVVGAKTVAPGEYSLFIDLKPNNWTLIISSWAAQQTYDPSNRNALWGSFDYTPAKDVARTKMTLQMLPFSVDQLTWNFLDMSDSGGKIGLMWDNVVASAPFTVGR